MKSKYYVWLMNKEGCQFDYGSFDTLEEAKEYASGRGRQYHVEIDSGNNGIGRATCYDGWLTPQGFKTYDGWNWQVVEPQWRSDRNYHAKSISENARYLVVYSKARSSFAMQTWKDTLQEADTLAEKLELTGYSVDIWKHTATGTRPVYSKDPILRAQIDAMQDLG